MRTYPTKVFQIVSSDFTTRMPDLLSCDRLPIPFNPNISDFLNIFPLLKYAHIPKRKSDNFQTTRSRVYCILQSEFHLNIYWFSCSHGSAWQTFSSQHRCVVINRKPQKTNKIESTCMEQWVRPHTPKNKSSCLNHAHTAKLCRSIWHTACALLFDGWWIQRWWGWLHTTLYSW